MEQKLFEALKLKFTGVSDATLKRIANKKAVGVKEEAEIPALIEAMTYDAVISSEVDFRITDANKKAVENYETRHGLREGKPISEPTPIPQPITDPNNIQKMIADAISAVVAPIQEKVLGFEKEKTQSQLMGKLTSKLKEKGISEAFYKGRNLTIETEADIETVATTIEADFEAFRQEQANEGVVISVPQAGAGGNTTGTLGAKIAEAQNAGASGGAEGKKIVIQN
jgi:hypothetical protein